MKKQKVLDQLLKRRKKLQKKYENYQDYKIYSSNMDSMRMIRGELEGVNYAIRLIRRAR